MNPIFKLRFVAFLICLCLGVCAFAQDVGIKFVGDKNGLQLAISKPFERVRNFPIIGDFDVSYFFSADSSLSFGAGPEKNFQIGKSNLFASVGLALQLQPNSRDRLELRGAISFGISIKTN